MGIYDRDFMREPSRSGPSLARLSVTTKLIIVNAVLWFVYAGAASAGGGLFRFIETYLILHPLDVFGRLRIWQPFTAIWFHNPYVLVHVGLNMLFLFFFGRHVETMIGRRSYTWLYLGAGMVSTLSLLPYAWITGDARPALGASGAIYGVCVFLAVRQPNLPIYFFFVIRMPLWVLVGVFMVGMELLNLTIWDRATGATIGHLAGAAYGLVHPRLAARLAGRGPTWPERLQRRQRRGRVERAEEDRAAVRQRVDDLLEKIGREGIGALTEEEKDYLERASRRYGRN